VSDQLVDNDNNPPVQKAKPSKQIRKFYGISLGGYVSQNLLQTYTPYFALALGTNYREQSLVTSTRLLGGSLTQSFWGMQSDKRGRRPLLLLGYGILALTTFLFTINIFTNISLFLILLAVQGFFGFSILPTVTNSMLGDVAPERERGAFVGKIISFGTLGAIPLLLLFGFLLDRQNLTGPSQYYLVFFSICVFILLTICVIISLKETLTKKPERSLPSPWSVVRQNKKFKKFLIIDASYLGMMAFVWPLMPFVVKDVAHATNTQISLIQIGWIIGMASAQRIAGGFSDRIGRKPLLILSRTMAISLPLLLALTSRWPTWILPLVAQSIGGFEWGLSLLMEQMIALDLAPRDQKAIYTGTIFTVTGVSGFLGSLFSGNFTQLLAVRLGQFPALFLMLWVATAGRLILGLAHFLIDETAPRKRNFEMEVSL